MTAKYTFYKLLKMWIVMITCGHRVILVWLSQCPGCWCPGSIHYQDISSHDIDYKCRIGRSFSYLRKDYNCLCHIIVEEQCSTLSVARLPILQKIPLGYGILKSCSPHGFWNFSVFYIIKIYGHDHDDKIWSGHRSSTSNGPNGSPLKYLKSYTGGMT